MRELFVCLALALASGAAGGPDERLAQAEMLAKKRELDGAADLYRALLAEGRDGTDLRYNLGTLCLEVGDIGCAVVHLRAAARMDPRDDDVRHNLAVAFEARADRLAGAPVVDPLRVVGARVPPLVARWALALPLALLGFAFVLMAMLHSPVRATASTAAMVAAVASIVGGGVYACRVIVEATEEAVVIVPETPALKEPDPGAAVAFTAHAGLHGEVVGRSLDASDLLRLRFDNGIEAWIKASDTVMVR
jgi:hypothetical protein